MLEEQELIQQVSAGDPAAREVFFRLYQPQLLRTSMYFLGAEEADVDGVVAATFHYALPRLKDQDFEQPIYSFLRQICLRLCHIQRCLRQG